jgi:methyl-accepting chemotaxis protein
MKKMALGMRMGLGFGMLIVLALALGSVAVWQMKQVKDGVTVLNNEYVAEVEVASHLELLALLTMVEMRGYGLTGETRYFESGMKHLQGVKQHILEAKVMNDN